MLSPTNFILFYIYFLIALPLPFIVLYIYYLFFYKYKCTLGLINKLYPKNLLYMQPLHKIFVVIQSHEYKLTL